MRSLSSEECDSGENLAREDHISRRLPARATICGVKPPIILPNVVLRTIPESARDAVNRPRRPFQFQEVAHWCFIQVQMNPAQPEGGAVFLIAEPRAEAQRPQRPRPARWLAQNRLALSLPLVSLRGRIARHRHLRGQNAPRRPPSRLALGPEPQQAPAPPQIAAGRVVKRVLLEHTLAASGPYRPNAADCLGQIAHAQLDFSLGCGAFSRRA